MDFVRADPERLAGLVKALRFVARDLDEGERRVRQEFVALESDWSDVHYIEVGDRLAELLQEIHNGIVALDAQAEWLEVLIRRLDGLETPPHLMTAGTGATANVGSVDRTTRLATEPPVGAYGRLATLPFVPGALGPHRIRLLDPSDFGPEDFDWTTTIPETEFEQAFHNNDPAAYREFVMEVREVMDLLREGQPIPQRLADCYSVWFRSQPVRLDRGPDGRIDIVNGRHRLWAAIKLGLPVPVEVAGTGCTTGPRPALTRRGSRPS